MARQIITQVWCDVCLQDDQYTEAEETPPLALGTMKPRILALCEVHTKELYWPFQQVLVELGQIIPSATNGPVSRGVPDKDSGGVFACPDPACEKHADPYTHKQSLRNHARHVHSATITALVEQYGQPPVPIELGAQARARQAEKVSATEATCPECGKVYAVPEYQQPTRALGVHRAKSHGVRGATKQPKGTSKKAS